MYCGGPTYEFEFFDKDAGKNGEGGYTTTGFGDDDIIRECDGPTSLGTVSIDQLVAKLEELTARVTKLEKKK